MTKSTRTWVGGLISNAAAGVSGAFASFTADMVTTGNWSWERCAIIAGVGMLIHVFGFLQKSPLPEIEETTTTITAKVTETKTTDAK